MDKDKSEAVVYIIDSDYRIVYFNQALRQNFPGLSTGSYCYRFLCGEEQPCGECPLNTSRTESKMLFNKLLNIWVEVDGAVFDTPDGKKYSIIMVREIKDDNRNLFYNLTKLSAYDELFELNLTADSYKILYHMDGKYVVPSPEGRLSSLVSEVADGMIHPDDRTAFLTFWDFNNILPRMECGASDSALTGQFRKKRVDGTWCWVMQTVVPLCQGTRDDQILMCFIQDIHREKLGMEKSLCQNPMQDTVMGIYKKDAFFRAAHVALIEKTEARWCLMAIDIEHFKLFNEWYGLQAGDEFLNGIAAELKQFQEEGALCGYLGEDDFGVLLPNCTEMPKKLQERITQCVRQYGNNAGFLPAFGLYAVESCTMPISTMYDRASLAVSKVKGNYAQRVSWYDDSMMQTMENDHVLLTDVQQGLERHEFTFYVQPKCNMDSGKIVGMESLVRWKHPVRGLVPPIKFIPALEKYGFISMLDRYIWEEVCKCLRNWIDKGYRPVPISVNVSRVDIYTMDVAEYFQELVKKYELEPSLLEIEITESAYSEDYRIVKDAAEKLRILGFTVSMDDFGSGYSSLNMLKDINVDILKIDMKFLEISGQSADKGLDILESVISMARLIGLRIIAEGVETKRQTEFLLRLGCSYGQGYYYYKPMPFKVFEPLLAKESNFDYRGIIAQRYDRLSLKELLNEDMITESLINNILGGIAFYDVSETEVRLIRANEQYFRIIGSSFSGDAGERKQDMENIYSEDRAIVFRIFQQARENRPDGAAGEVRYLREDGNTIWLSIRAFFLRDVDGRSLFYAALSDNTGQRHREQQLENSQRALSAVVHISENDTSFMKLTEENRRVAASIFAQMSPGGMIGGYCEEGFPLYFANNAIIKLMGYDSFEELSQAIGGMVINTIHPEDRASVARDIGPSYYPGLEYTTTYRMPKKDGSWFWTLDKGRVIQAEDGRLAIVSACTDISETMSAQRQLAERNALLLRRICHPL